MDRYAVIDQENKVVNVIIWDGLAKWAPPAGCRVEASTEACRGDIWMPAINDFMRPLSLVKLPEDDVSIAEKTASYLAAKESFKASIMFLNDQGVAEV